MDIVEHVRQAGGADARTIELAEQIVVFGDPVLRVTARRVDRFDEYTIALAQHMASVLLGAGGVGLAAPQVGHASRMITYRLGETAEHPVAILINPTWESLNAGQQPAYEGCLSLPGMKLPVLRERVIRVSGQDLTGNAVQFDAEDLEARVIQHECDHLDGVLIFDRVMPQLRYEALLAWNRAAPNTYTDTPTLAVNPSSVTASAPASAPAVQMLQREALERAAAALERGEI